MTETRIGMVTDTPGSGKRAQRKRLERLFEGTVKQRARYTGRFASLARVAVASTPHYTVRPIRDSWIDPTTRYRATGALVRRLPSRVIPESERPSPVVTTPVS